MSEIEHVYNLWPDTAAMSRDLGTSVVDLIRLKSRGLLPPQRHDEAIERRALSVGRPLSMRAIRGRPDKSPALKSRGSEIRAFVKAGGGYAAMARRMNVTPNAVRLYASKGYIPRAHQWTLMNFAKAIDYDLDEALFQKPEAGE